MRGTKRSGKRALRSEGRLAPEQLDRLRQRTMAAEQMTAEQATASVLDGFRRAIVGELALLNVERLARRRALAADLPLF